MKTTITSTSLREQARKNLPGATPALTWRYKLCKRRAWGSVLVATVLSLFVANASAQGYPSQAIKLVVPTGAGGGMDLMARVVSAKMSAILSQSIVVENKPGANGSIGAAQVVNSAPDGYTMLLGQTAQFAINPYLYSSLPYDAVKGFVPVVLIADAPNVVVVADQSPYKNLSDLVAAATKENVSGQRLNLATPGNGTVSHLTGELFQHSAGIQLAHIPYKGAATAITDTIAGRVQVLMSSVPTSLSQIKNGRLRAIAVSAAKRSPALPDVPTIGESGYPGFDAGTWYGLFVPAGTSKEIVARLNAAANEALTSSDVKKTIQSEGGDVLGGTSDAFAAVIRADSAKWSKVVAESGAKID